MSDDLYDGPTVLAPGPGRLSGDRLARLLFWPLAVTLATLITVVYVIYSPVRIDGESMFPSLRSGDRVLRTKSYEEPRRGDVIVAVLPAEKAGGGEIVKRVIGIAGDEVEIRDDIALVNGAVEDTSRIELARGDGDYRKPIVVPEGSVYVLGDNRPISLDSRYIGTIPVSAVQGRIAWVFLPLHRAGGVE